ncbi:hypothetical protein [Rhizobium sp. ZPR3]|uniref:Uncharacterized protein n=2 Tax=unclassified Rhizobium TaxID=2613769 RepID=A0AAU7SB93_9HYPH
MSTAKLHINIAQGIIDAEGDAEFVLKVYEDFRDRLGNAVDWGGLAEGDSDADQADETPATAKATAGSKKNKIKKPPSGKPQRASNGATYKPRLVDDLDTQGLKEFIADYNMTTHANNIVAFLKFLEGKGRKPATFDEVFTCYTDAGIKVPTAFVQAFRDTASKKKFIEFTDSGGVELTLRGGNHINHGSMSKKGDLA